MTGVQTCALPILFNLVIAYGLMMLDVFTLITFVLSLYANVVMAWLVTIALRLVASRTVGDGLAYVTYEVIGAA